MPQKFSDELIDQLLGNYTKPEDLMGEGGVLKELTKRLIERAMTAEMTDHLGYEKGHARENKNGNSRNGYSSKTITGDFGETEIQVPRDRDSSFDPQIVKKGQKRFKGFDDKVISMYARGMTTREIQGHLEEIYGVEVSPTLISNVTKDVLEDAKAWQCRSLDEVYPVVYFDAMRVKVRSDGEIKNKSVFMALAIKTNGVKELLGMWVYETEGAKLWLNILTELQNRGVKDIFIACVDGLTGFPEAIKSSFPKTSVQLCIVHMVRNSLRFVPKKEAKAVADGLKNIYSAATLKQAESRLDRFAKEWDEKYPAISKSWFKHWDDLTTFMAYPPEIRRILYTTNPMESVNRSFRKISKTRSVFPSDESVHKLFYLAFKNISKKWRLPVHHWTAALNRFAIQFEGRMPF